MFLMEQSPAELDMSPKNLAAGFVETFAVWNQQPETGRIRDQHPPIGQRPERIFVAQAQGHGPGRRAKGPIGGQGPLRYGNDLLDDRDQVSVVQRLLQFLANRIRQLGPAFHQRPFPTSAVHQRDRFRTGRERKAGDRSQTDCPLARCIRPDEMTPGIARQRQGAEIQPG